MPRLSETHHLPDLREESEYDLWSDRFGSWIGRSSKSRSPDSMKHLRWERKSSSGVSSVSPDCFYEATGRRSSSDHGHDLTIDTDSFMIGNRVFVGGVKPGRITFIGEVHFAPGEWAGIVLDEPEGKNDGAVSGKRYFQCEPKKGIFSRLTRLTRERIVTASTPDGSMDTTFRSMTSPARSGTTSPSYSNYQASTKTSNSMQIGDRVIVKSATGSKIGYLRFHGEPDFASGIWCGIEFEDATGKNDGTVGGKRYFLCAPNHGLFVPEAKVALSPMARRARMSRTNSQESLTSNITLGSLASTNTTKLRLNATQKRLSSLNKTPSVTSTPKPSFSLQDILREKTNHIEQLIKERETDREEMSAQSILFQKNLNLYKEKVLLLNKQLDDEKKKSEDLQFFIDEAAISAEDSDGALKKYTDRIVQLESEINDRNSGGDRASPLASGQIELEHLRKELEETKAKLRGADEMKNVLGNEIQVLHVKLTELSNDFDLKSSGVKATEECMKDELNYLEKRVQDLELELSEKEKTIELQEIEAKLTNASTNKEISRLELQLKEKIQALSGNESTLTEQIDAKNQEIGNLRTELESLTASEMGIKETIKEKDSEILRMLEKQTALMDRVGQLEKVLNEKAEIIMKKELEQTSLQAKFASIETVFNSLQKSVEQQSEELAAKTDINQQLQSKVDERSNQISSLQLELDHFKSSTDDLNASIQKSNKIEEELRDEIAELTKSQLKLNHDIVNKNSQVSAAEALNLKLQKEISERDKCIAGLEAEVKSVNQIVVEKEATITQKTKECSELEAKRQTSVNDLEMSKQVFAEELNAAKRSMDEALEGFKSETGETVKALTVQITDLNKQRNEKENELAKRVKDVALLSEVKSQLDDQLLALENELKELTIKLTTNERDVAEKSSQIERLSNALDETTRKLQEAETTSKNLQNDKNALEVDKNDLRRKLCASEEKIGHLNEHKSKLHQDLEATKSSSLDINSELLKMHNELREKQVSLENIQTEAETVKLNLQRRVDEVERQNQLLEQQLNKLKTEMEALHVQKIESENQLNQELQNIKLSSDEEKTELGKELNQLRSNFETEKIQLKREKQQLQENLENLCGELQGKSQEFESTIAALRIEIDSAKNRSKLSESSLSGLVDDLKKKEMKLSEALDKQNLHVDNLKKSIEELQASKEILKNEYEEKLELLENKMSKLDENLVNATTQQNSTALETEEKAKVLYEIHQKCYQQQQKIVELTHNLENERIVKKNLELNIESFQSKYRELEDEQVDLVNRKEQLKIEKESVMQQFEQLKQSYKVLAEKLDVEKKESEKSMAAADDRINKMEQEILNLQQASIEKDRENTVTIEKLQLREGEVLSLQAVVKSLELKIETEASDALKLVKDKEEELLKTLSDCKMKDKLIAELQHNLENLKTCLTTWSAEKESTTNLVQKLNQEVSSRDSDIRDLKMKLFSVEKLNKEIENQMKNIVASKDATIAESQAQIADMMEQVQLLDQVKEKEVLELSSKLSLLQGQLKTNESSTVRLDASRRHKSELELKIKDLELRETELLLLTQELKRKNTELETTRIIPMTDNADDQELQKQVEFLNAIIADMHKTNVDLTHKVEVLSSGKAKSTGKAEESSHDFDLNFLVKKKPAPRLYCDICEEFDAHDTEDCPTQCSEMDLPAPKKNKIDKKKASPRMFCDHCDVFDAHETDDCPVGEDQTF